MWLYLKNLDDEKEIIQQKSKRQNIGDIDGKRKFCNNNFNFILIFNISYR
jgi:hypothetical protein